MSDGRSMESPVGEEFGFVGFDGEDPLFAETYTVKFWIGAEVQGGV